MSKNGDLSKFLNKFRTTSSEFNIVSIGGPGFQIGKFNIDRKNFKQFLKLYHEFIFVHNQKCYLLETPFTPNNKPFINDANDSLKDHNLIKIDIDIKTAYNNDIPEKDQLQHKYTHKHILKLVNLYINALNNYLKLGDNNEIENIEFYLLERDEGYIHTKNNAKTVKDGIHIAVPYYLINNNILHKVRKDVLAHPDFISIYNELGQDNPIEDLLDCSVISKNSWFMYGSGKAFTEPYLLTKIYKFKKYSKSKDGGQKQIKYVESDDSFLEEMLKDKFKLLTRLSLNSVNKCLEPISEQIITELSIEFESSSEYNQLASGTNNNTNIFSNNRNVAFKKPVSTIKLSTLKLLVGCFKAERASDYTDWWRIGQALFNIDWQNGFIAWIEFSRLCGPKFNINNCKKKWGEFEENYISCKYQYNLAFIKNLAKKDNPMEFNKIYDFLKMNILNDMVDTFRQPLYAKKIGDSTLSKKVAAYIKADAKHYFIAIDNNIWFFYQNHRWIISKEGVEIKRYLKDVILPIFIDYHTKCIDANKQIHNENEKLKLQSTIAQSQGQNMDSMMNLGIDQISNNLNTLESNRDTTQENILKQSIYEERIKTAQRLVTYLESATNRNTLVKELTTEFNDSNFYSNLDCNPNVIHCSNGVYDLAESKFRDGVPDDMITITSNNQYITDMERYTNTNYTECEEGFNDFLDKLFPEYEVKEYILNSLAISLSGKSLVQTFNVCIGSGSNGKSVLFDFLEYVFGDYFSSASPALLTKGRGDANTVSPAIASLRGKRLICCSEPDEKEPIKTGVMKELTGGDKLVGRHLHMAPIEFRPQHTIFFACNDPPEVQTTDEGTWRRIRVVPFISKFVDSDNIVLKANKTPYHFPKDPNIKNNFSVWKPLFLNELINRHNNLKANNFRLETPEKIKMANLEYKKDHNIYESFKNECLIKRTGERLPVNEAFKVFTESCKVNNQKINKINKNNFITEMNRLIGGIKSNKYWKDWAIIEDTGEYDDDEDDSNLSAQSNDDSDNDN
jgi:P4 family phage/plasmid primase-like protien